MTKEEVSLLVEQNVSLSMIAAQFNIGYRKLIKLLREFDIDYKGNKSGAGTTKPKVKLIDVFANKASLSSSQLRMRLLSEGLKEYKCENPECNISEWLGKKISLELDHVDGNGNNNELINLRLLCPNCHSQTPHFRGRNINTGVNKVSDEDLINALKENTSIRSALLFLGLTPKGGNYKRAIRLMPK